MGKVLDVLALAKESVERGWKQSGWGPEGVYSLDGKRHTAEEAYDYLPGSASCTCAGLAVCFAVDTRLPDFHSSAGVEITAMHALREAAGLPYSVEPLAVIAHWNDHRDRTKAEVLATFDRAIAAEKAKENA